MTNKKFENIQRKNDIIYCPLRKSGWNQIYGFRLHCMLIPYILCSLTAEQAMQIKKRNKCCGGEITLENQNLEWKESRDNPLIAGTFFRSGQIEAWGRGIEKISEACKSWGKPEPFYKIRSNEVMIGFNTNDGIVENIVENETQVTILELMCRALDSENV